MVHGGIAPSVAIHPPSHGTKASNPTPGTNNVAPQQAVQQAAPAIGPATARCCCMIAANIRTVIISKVLTISVSFNLNEDELYQWIYYVAKLILYVIYIYTKVS